MSQAKTSASLRFARRKAIGTDSQETTDEYMSDFGTSVLLPLAQKCAFLVKDPSSLTLNKKWHVISF